MNLELCTGGVWEQKRIRTRLLNCIKKRHNMIVLKEVGLISDDEVETKRKRTAKQRHRLLKQERH